MRNILDYIKVFKNIETYKDPRSTALGPRNTYQDGQLVTPSVDGSRPGYQGRPPPIDAGSRSESLKRLLPKDKSKYISITELRNLLGDKAKDMRPASPGGLKAKDTAVAKAAAKLLDQTEIMGPGRDRPSSAKFYFYKNPTKKELNLLKSYIDVRTIRPDMLERIQNIQKDKYTTKILKNGRLPMVGKGNDKVLDPKFLKHVQGKYGTLDKYVHGLVRYTQGLDGQTIYGLNDSILSDGKFKTNKKLANQIRNVFLELPYGTNNAHFNSIRKAVYGLAMSDITKELGNQNTTFEGWKNKIRSTLTNKYNLKNAGLEIDELIGVSSSFRNKTAPYSVFTRITTEKLNQGILKDYQKVLSNHTAKLKTEIGNSSKFVDGKWFHSPKAKEIVTNFNKNILPGLKNIDQLKGTGISLPELTLGAPTDKTLGGAKGRLAALEKAGLDFTKFYKTEGFGMDMPKGVVTQKELVANPELMEKQLSQAGVPEEFMKNRKLLIEKAKANAALKTAKKGGFGEQVKKICGLAKGGRVGFALGPDSCALIESDPERFMDELVHIEKGVVGNFFKTAKAAKIAKGVARSANILTKPMSWIGGELLYVGLEGMNSRSKGVSWKEALDDAFIFHDFKQVDENIMDTASKMNLDENSMALLKNTMDINRIDSELGKAKSFLKMEQIGLPEGNLIGRDPSDLTDQQNTVASYQRYISDKQEQLNNEIGVYMSSVGKLFNKDPNTLDDSELYKGFGILSNVFRKKVLTERQEAYKGIATRSKPLGGNIGQWDIFDLGSWTQPVKWAADVVNPFTKDVPYLSEHQKRKQYLEEIGREFIPGTKIPNPKYNPRELYLYNKQRGLTLDSPLVDEALALRTESQPVLGTGWFSNRPYASGGRAGYMGGGIAAIRKPNALPPTGGPQSGGLPSLYNNGRKL